MKPVKILIADDHAVVRGGLRQFFQATPDLELAGEASTGAEALEMARQQHWDVVLLDIALPDLNGFAVLRRLKQEHPGLPVLIFSMFAEEEFALSALNAGAAGFLSKDSPPSQILAAIRRVIGGARYVSPALAERLLAGSVPAAKPLPHEALSPREMEVLLQLSRGMSLTGIGEALNLSVKTVSTYRGRILDKLGAQSNADLVRYVLEHKLG
jgi:two-component system, NarL family, invasion response regulator UvrY